MFAGNVLSGLARKFLWVSFVWVLFFWVLFLWVLFLCLGAVVAGWVPEIVALTLTSRVVERGGAVFRAICTRSGVPNTESVPTTFPTLCTFLV